MSDDGMNDAGGDPPIGESEPTVPMGAVPPDAAAPPGGTVPPMPPGGPTEPPGPPDPWYRNRAALATVIFLALALLFLLVALIVWASSGDDEAATTTTSTTTTTVPETTTSSSTTSTTTSSTSTTTTTTTTTPTTTTTTTPTTSTTTTVPATTTLPATTTSTTIPVVTVPPQPGATLWDVIVNSPDLSNLRSLVSVAGLQPLLDDPDATYTLLAPSNPAIENAEAGLGAPDFDDPDVVRPILLTHTHVGDAYTTEELLALDEIVVEVGGPHAVDATVTPPTVGGAGIIVVEVEAANGTLFVIDQVLRP